MNKALLRVSFWNKLFNVNSNEWSRILIAWFLRFFYRAAFVVAWTVLVASFIGDFGIRYLPYLLILNAFFTMVGSFFYAALLDSFKREYVILATIFASVLILLAALFFSFGSTVLFFAFLLVAISVCMAQLKMLLSAYVEDMFDSLESERVFPLIEASDTFAGIVAGLLISSLSGLLPVDYFIYIWIFSVLMILPLMVMHKISDYDLFLVPESRIKRRFYLGVFDKLKDVFVGMERFAYLKGLVVIVFLQWLIFNLLEYQYTVAVFENISSVFVGAGSGFEHAFIHDLGIFFVLFSFSALLIQLFIGSRILTGLGVVGTMLMHVVVTFFSVLTLVFSFVLPAVVFAKNSFVMTSILHTNAYHSSYYVIDEKYRATIREFLDGVVRPFGALFGSVALVLLQSFLHDSVLVVYNNYLILAVVLLMFFVTYRQRFKYTDLAVNDLLHSKDKYVRLNAIGILGQAGHGVSRRVLDSVLLDEKALVSLRLEVLSVFEFLDDFEALPAVLKVLSSKKIAVRKAALNVLLRSSYLNLSAEKYVIFRGDLLNVLKEMYRSEGDDEVILLRIMNLMFLVSEVWAVGFLSEVLRKRDSGHEIYAIRALSSYSDESVIEVLRPYLFSKKLREQLYALIALAKFDVMRSECFGVLEGFVSSKSVTHLAYALYAVGELGLVDYKGLCYKSLSSKSDFLKMHACLALVKLGDETLLPVLVDLLFLSDSDIPRRLKVLIEFVDVNVSSKLSVILKRQVSERILVLMDDLGAEVLDDLGVDALERLRWFYFLINEYDEVDLIDSMIKVS